MPAANARMKAFMKRYRAAQRNYKPSAEEMYEMQANFEPSDTIVNVLTGKVVAKIPKKNFSGLLTKGTSSW